MLVCVYGTMSCLTVSVVEEYKMWSQSTHISTTTCTHAISITKKYIYIFPNAFFLQSCMLVVANNLLEAESQVKTAERETFLAEKCPPLDVPYSREELVVSGKVFNYILGIILPSWISFDIYFSLPFQKC